MGIREGTWVHIPFERQGFREPEHDLGRSAKVILLQTGNCSTARIEQIIRHNAVRFTEFENDARRSLLILK
jgi:predicted nuclease of predicted toxin-antitoxin system